MAVNPGDGVKFVDSVRDPRWHDGYCGVVWHASQAGRRDRGAGVRLRACDGATVCGDMDAQAREGAAMIAAAYRVRPAKRWRAVEALAWDGVMLELVAALPTGVLLGDVVWQVDGRVYTQRRVDTMRWVVWLQERESK